MASIMHLFPHNASNKTSYNLPGRQGENGVGVTEQAELKHAPLATSGWGGAPVTYDRALSCLTFHILFVTHMQSMPFKSLQMLIRTNVSLK